MTRKTPGIQSLIYRGLNIRFRACCSIAEIGMAMIIGPLHFKNLKIREFENLEMKHPCLSINTQRIMIIRSPIFRTNTSNCGCSM
jgi:hypothetical protein